MRAGRGGRLLAMGAAALASTTVAAQAQAQAAPARGPVSVPLAYKSTPATAGQRQQHYLGIGTMHIDTSGLRASDGAAGGDVLAAVLDFVAVTDPSSNAVKAATAPVEKLEALNPQIWAYFASLEFQGNQKQDVLVDTGSAGMGVPVEQPQNWTDPGFDKLDPKAANGQVILCNDPRCRGACDKPDQAHFCSPNGGSCVATPDGTNICTFAWLYGDGSSASGFLLSAPVGLAGLTATTTFGAISNASLNFFESPTGGGIMGMSFGGYSLCDAEFSCFPPLFDDFVAQHGLQNKFSMCQWGMDGGALVLGGGDNNLRVGDLKVAPMQPPYGFYSVGVEDVTLGQTRILPEGNTRGPRLRGGQYKDEGKISTIVDTGNSALYMPEAIYNNFKTELLKVLAQWPDLADPQRNLFTGYAVYVPPEVLSQLPPLSITLDGGAVLSLRADEYTVEFQIPEAPVPIRALKILKSNRFVLGQTVLSRQYLEFDRDAKTVGFAPSKPGCPL